MNPLTELRKQKAFRLPYSSSKKGELEGKLQKILSSGWKIKDMFIYLPTTRRDSEWMLLVCCIPETRSGKRTVTIERVSIPDSNEIDLVEVLGEPRYCRTYRALMPSGERFLVVGVTKQENLNDSDSL